MKFGSIVAIAFCGATLAGCGIFGGDGKLSPDEFEVVDRAPLVIPPESELRPPRPGEPRAQEIDPGRQAYEALFPGATLTPQPPKSSGELSLLRRIDGGDPDIRSNVAQKNLDVVKKRLLLADLLEADDRTYRPDNVTVERVQGN
ncbi:DUF3035 domain-containing protein [Pseudokordiimonas caeni]|uniref:DUF3035 domain-containing protein n=1 Tax=Pseudokordiimonas caeni TaxID=2997908 RepID=UPI002811B12E|nr:DUF3035 domain-containing protein [Pseudokordiimonas caeni]